MIIRSEPKLDTILRFWKFASAVGVVAVALGACMTPMSAKMIVCGALVAGFSYMIVLALR